ncbi:hypothetical protein Poli38472_009932 [Pythium oligandrum]|uniref:Uncharacterized protein n=1 Tax=Pythium oligandrum TaxID=41045 RepID=A0A8K1C8Y6_PYTOL|nr:hypothetical protein Poli38472_009932 [Pythium oligandrum]|eukprot:TMW58373.1 hypothetical protein Poli38472_009932 [Pythium oligandrum]
MAVRCLVSTIVLAIVPLASGIGFEVITGDVFPSLSRSWPKHVDISSITPLFDMDDNGCYPAAVISRSGEPNRGLETDGGNYDVCKRDDFLEYSNTYHRYACRVADNIKYCSHFFTLYFQKDEATLIGGHRHDLEQVVIWTMDGNVTHGSFSAHGGMTTWSASSIPHEGSHLKFVYHKDNIMTHAMRFARTKDALDPENPYKKFVLPPVVSWYTMKGDGDLTNSALRQLLNTLPYGKATMPIKDSVFLRNLNMRRPQGYPEFDDEDIKSSQ